jgi:hypothetical protein
LGLPGCDVGLAVTDVSNGPISCIIKGEVDLKKRKFFTPQHRTPQLNQYDKNKSHKRDLLTDKKITPVAEHFFGGYATG